MSKKSGLEIALSDEFGAIVERQEEISEQQAELERERVDPLLKYVKQHFDNYVKEVMNEELPEGCFLGLTRGAKYIGSEGFRIKAGSLRENWLKTEMPTKKIINQISSLTHDYVDHVSWVNGVEYDFYVS